MGDLHVYLGIPFAKPPVGRRRFGDPEPVDSWAPRVHDATFFRPDCLQNVDTYSPTTDQSEDCLYLNVWAPARRSRPLPVIVWIHGGAFRTGGSSYQCYNTSALARQGNVVVVSINYRLGPFGFLALSSVNAGLGDQRMALRWVQDNIGFLGGDPAAVTLVGESAGAMSIGLHLVETRGLFSRAVLMSNPLSYRFRSLAFAERLSRAFLERLGCDSLACAQDETATAVLSHSEMVALPRHVSDFIWWAPVAPVGWKRGPFGPNALSLLDAIGGSDRAHSHGELTKGQYRLIAARAPQPRPPVADIPDMPLVLGTTEHEGDFFLAYAYPRPMARSVYWATVALLFRRAARRVLRLYAMRGERLVDYRPVLARILTDYMFRCPAQRLAAKLRGEPRRSPLWLYLFAQRSNHTPLPRCKGLACHTMELPFLFGQPEEGLAFTTKERKLSDVMLRAWATFARREEDGDLDLIPDDGGWPPWTMGRGITKGFEWPLGHVSHDTCDEACAFWDTTAYRF